MARVVYDYLSAVRFPAISHTVEVFSEGACLAAAFPNRTISPVGKVGFHQAAMLLEKGSFAESKISDLLQQVQGHNRAMVAQLAKSLGQPSETVRKWVYDGAAFVGDEAVNEGIANAIAEPFHPRPVEHIIMK